MANLPKESNHCSEITTSFKMKDQEKSACQIYNYESPWKTYSLGYSFRQDQKFRLGLGSFLDGKNNKVLMIIREIDRNNSAFTR